MLQDERRTLRLRGRHSVTELNPSPMNSKHAKCRKPDSCTTRYYVWEMFKIRKSKCQQMSPFQKLGEGEW